jgi:hypothetical protein
VKKGKKKWKQIKKKKKEKEYSIVSIQNLVFPHYSTDIKLLHSIFSSKYFITLILNHHNNIFILFQKGEISICGKTGKIRFCFQKTNLHPPISFFISENKTYLMCPILKQV